MRGTADQGRKIWWILLDFSCKSAVAFVLFIWGGGLAKPYKSNRSCCVNAQHEIHDVIQGQHETRIGIRFKGAIGISSTACFNSIAKTLANLDLAFIID